MIKQTVIILLSVTMIGCASTKSTFENTASITITDTMVEFTTSSPTKMTWKNGEKEYTFDSQAQSWLSKLTGYVLGGLLGKR